MGPGSSPVIVLPGAGNTALDLSMFATPSDAICFKRISYPGWRRLVDKGFSVEVLVSELSSQIATIVPQGPIRILGFSTGGHFGYAAALQLQACGREIASFCAIDSFIIPPSVQRAPGQNCYRILARGLNLMREARLGDLSKSVRLRVCRAMIRSAGDRLPSLLHSLARLGRLAAIFGRDQLFAEEISELLLIHRAQPWIKSLDIEPIALKVPAILFRTLETAGDDRAWRQRCPDMKIFEIPGNHRTVTEVLENSRRPATMFAPNNIGAIRESFLSTIAATA
jgi:thioesterase domain-containing protein